MKIITTLLLCLVSTLLFAQKKNAKPVYVLFVGNSYIFFNSLPQICTGLAGSIGDVLITESSTVGGYSMKQHFADSNTINKIISGTPDYQNRVRRSWDYVVLQDQSQYPSNPIVEVEQNVFPYARYLDSTIHKYNPLAKTVFYSTWGRKNGDSARCSKWSPVCTYKGMDSLLQMRYMMMAEKNNGWVAPVSAVWRILREKYPSIELYDADNSHPSEAGSYAAACCFYTVFFKKDPTLATFDYTLSHSDALYIRRVVKNVVYNNLGKWLIK
jgi:hypothetical protein